MEYSIFECLDFTKKRFSTFLKGNFFLDFGWENIGLKHPVCILFLISVSFTILKIYYNLVILLNTEMKLYNTNLDSNLVFVVF